MTHSTVKVELACERYLDWVADAKRGMKRIERDRQAMREAADGIKAVRYDRDGGKSSMLHGDDAMAAAVTKLEEVDRRLSEKYMEYAQAEEEWSLIKCKLPAIEADALEFHYINGRTWDEVAFALMYSERNIYRIRVDALFDLYELLPQGWQ